MRSTLIPVVLLMVLFVAGCQSNASQPAPMAEASLELPTMMVYKSPTCGCCSKWVDYLRAQGMEVKTQDMEDMRSIKERFGVPDKLASCHTAVVGGYVVEGHVPIEDIRRLLQERPNATGITVPGMPIGSPGMEVEGRPADAYQVVQFDAQGTTKVFATH